MEKEKNPYMISIVGEQKVEGQDDRIEVITEGKYMMKNLSGKSSSYSL